MAEVNSKLNMRALLDVVGIDPERMRENETHHLAVQHGASDYIPLLCGAGLTQEQEEALPGARDGIEEFNSHEKTLLNGLQGAASVANADSDSTPAIRANTGVATAATPFGVKQEIFADKMPWVRDHLPLATFDDFDADAAPLGEVAEMALERSRFLAGRLRGSGITPFCFDTQSPFDLAQLVVGDEIFYAIYDEPDRVHRLLDQCTRMIVRLTKLYKQAVGEPIDGGRHGNFAMRGGIRVCEDTCTLLNEEQVNEFMVPYTRRLLQQFGGGWLHYCGRNDHLYKAALDSIPEFYMINMGNPEMHDMQQVIADCLERGKTYFGYVNREQGEGTKQYLHRVLGYTQGTGRGLIFQAAIGDDTDGPGMVRLWREMQGKARR